MNLTQLALVVHAKVGFWFIKNKKTANLTAVIYSLFYSRLPSIWSKYAKLNWHVCNQYWYTSKDTTATPPRNAGSKDFRVTVTLKNQKKWERFMGNRPGVVFR